MVLTLGCLQWVACGRELTPSLGIALLVAVGVHEVDPKGARADLGQLGEPARPFQCAPAVGLFLLTEVSGVTGMRVNDVLDPDLLPVVQGLELKGRVMEPRFLLVEIFRSRCAPFTTTGDCSPVFLVAVDATCFREGHGEVAQVWVLKVLRLSDLAYVPFSEAFAGLVRHFALDLRVALAAICCLDGERAFVRN